MKKYFALAFMALVFSKSFSQNDAVVITGTGKINKNMAPHEIVDTLIKIFLDAKAVKYYKIPADAAKNGWTISQDDNLGAGDVVEYYTISFKRSDMHYYGLFKADGTLVKEKMEQKVDKLPEPIKMSIETLKKDHPDYKVVSKTFYKNIDNNSNEEYYEILAKNGKDDKKLYYKPDGTLIKIK